MQTTVLKIYMGVICVLYHDEIIISVKYKNNNNDNGQTKSLKRMHDKTASGRITS